MRILSTALITAGLVVLADAALTLLWQEPVSAAYASLQQSRASDELAELESEFDPGDVGFLSANASDAARARVLAERFQETISKGQPIGRLKIESIGLDTVLMNGTDTSTLQKGPGRYPQTPLPGYGETTGIAGHRTTYLAPLRKINEIEDGDEIRVELPYRTFTYEVEKHEIVKPSVRDRRSGRLKRRADRLPPLYSAAQRACSATDPDRYLRDHGRGRVGGPG
jgi:sortase A